MNQNQVPPAPPPMNQNPGHHDPYEFILNPTKQPKKSLLPSGNSKQQRIILAAGGAIILLMLIFVVMSLLSSAGSALKQDWLKVVQQQTEIIRVSDVGVQKARDKDAKNLAVTTKLSVESSLLELKGFAEKAGADIDDKQLALGRDAQTDSTLTQAEQTNQFDTVFVITMQKLLRDYQQTVKRLYDATGKDTTKTQLLEAYTSAGLLISEQSE